MRSDSRSPVTWPGIAASTREAYTLDLHQFTGWCRARSVPLFSVRRADIETFARELESRGRARATVSRRLSTIAGFYRYAVEEELLDHSPAAHVRRPRLDYESHATALDRNEVGALLVAAGLGAAAEHALISLLALNGLRVSEATCRPAARAANLFAPVGDLVLPAMRDVQEAASHADPRMSPPTSQDPPGSPRRRPSRPDRPISGQAMTPGQTRCHGRVSHGNSNLGFRDGINAGAVRLRAGA